MASNFAGYGMEVMVFYLVFYILEYDNNLIIIQYLLRGCIAVFSITLEHHRGPNLFSKLLKNGVILRDLTSPRGIRYCSFLLHYP